jgi:hypothetical protein
METTTQTRIGIGDVGGLIMWAAGLCLILIGLVLAGSSDELFPGPGADFLMLGMLAMFTGLCWSLASMGAAVTLLGREHGRATTALWLNATPWCSTALVIGTAWALSAS